ncbi:hypothetical protein [Priestia filamentosa]|uniref:hypothetical protein n=1 Tax=Priestia filamentosa TaxID=1402861 RepID=UPI003981CEF2
MKLYFSDEYLGDIESPKVEGLWMYGTIKPTESLEKYRDFFEALLDEDNQFNEEEYDEKLLNDYNWYIIDDEGKKKGIDLPTIHPTGDIDWRWI